MFGLFYITISLSGKFVNLDYASDWTKFFRQNL